MGSALSAMSPTHSAFPCTAPQTVAELQGLYGAFCFPERLFQQIWHRGDYNSDEVRTADGRPLAIRHPGRWNHLGGPDFIGARLRIDELEVHGDVELHLNAKDWVAHRHAEDPAYDNVVLHVVLFPCTEVFSAGAAGRRLPILCLLPRLHNGLEEYAADAAIEQLAGRPLHLAQQTLGELSNEDLDTVLRQQAERRWGAKVHFARERLKRLGWAAACHHAALEILGYRFNRAPMLTVAAARPLNAWAGGHVDPLHVFNESGYRWSLQGVRPLNHPRLRLRQYADWCVARPEWVQRLRSGEFWQALVSAPAKADPGAWRRTVRLAALRTRIQDELCAGVISGSRFDNLMSDGFMPLLTAETGMDLGAAWTAWFAGDAPESAVCALKALGVFGGRSRPVAVGPIQGFLSWMVERETLARSEKRPADGRGT